MLGIFGDEPECADPYFTETNLYTRRADYHQEEVSYVEYEKGSDIPVAIGAGVHHSFSLDEVSGRLKAGGELYNVTYLDFIGVAQGHRGKRLGKYVSLSCLHALKRRGMKYCTLWTQPHRSSAVAMYEKLGFVVTARVVALEKLW